MNKILNFNKSEQKRQYAVFTLFTKSEQYWYGAQLEGILGLSFLYTGVTVVDFRDLGNKLCRKDKFIR